jgi:hypothetical protein
MSQKWVNIIGRMPKKGDLVRLTQLMLSSKSYHGQTTYRCDRDDRGPALCSGVIRDPDAKYVTLQFHDRMEWFFFEEDKDKRPFAKYELGVIENEK